MLMQVTRVQASILSPTVPVYPLQASASGVHEADTSETVARNNNTNISSNNLLDDSIALPPTINVINTVFFMPFLSSLGYLKERKIARVISQYI
jgi:hypothetical protein